MFKMTGLKNGIVNVFTLHTTTAVTINEDDAKLEGDIARFMVKLVPEDDSYAHHRFFRKDGRMAVNAYSHIRASLLGSSVTYASAGRQVAAWLQAKHLPG